MLVGYFGLTLLAIPQKKQATSCEFDIPKKQQAKSSEFLAHCSAQKINNRSFVTLLCALLKKETIGVSSHCSAQKRNKRPLQSFPHL